jgi:hypothetical protein
VPAEQSLVNREGTVMGISAVGGVGSVRSHAPAVSVSKPESIEIPGAPDRDGDADNRVQAAATKPAAVKPGQVNVKA